MTIEHRTITPLAHPALLPVDPITPDAVPWSRHEGHVTEADYAAYLVRQSDAEAAEAIGVIDDFGRFVDFLGARFADWIDTPQVTT